MFGFFKRQPKTYLGYSVLTAHFESPLLGTEWESEITAHFYTRPDGKKWVEVDDPNLQSKVEAFPEIASWLRDTGQGPTEAPVHFPSQEGTNTYGIAGNTQRVA